MTGKTIGIVAIVIIVLFGIWYLLSRNPGESPLDNFPNTIGTTTPGVTIEYTESGFSPANVTVPVGTEVTFVNKTNDRMRVASAMHPVHAVYDGTTAEVHCASGYTGPKPFDQCDDGERYDFTFLKPGTWAYHNHANSARFGSVIVTP